LPRSTLGLVAAEVSCALRPMLGLAVRAAGLTSRAIDALPILLAGTLSRGCEAAALIPLLGWVCGGGRLSPKTIALTDAAYAIVAPAGGVGPSWAAPTDAVDWYTERLGSARAGRPRALVAWQKGHKQVGVSDPWAI